MTLEGAVQSISMLFVKGPTLAMKIGLSAAAALVLLIPAACANKVAEVTPEIQAGMMSDLQAGKLVLDCGAGCSLSWAQSASGIQALDLAEKWDDVATKVMQIGYGQDLSYYYLGQAAQGLGYHRAAITYYNYALGLATGQDALAKCASGKTSLGDPCQGVDLTSSIPVLVEASRNALAEQNEQQASVVHRRPRHRTPAAPAATSTTNAAAAADTTNGSGWVMPSASGSTSQ